MNAPGVENKVCECLCVCAHCTSVRIIFNTLPVEMTDQRRICELIFLLIRKLFKNQMHTLAHTVKCFLYIYRYEG